MAKHKVDIVGINTNDIINLAKVYSLNETTLKFEEAVIYNKDQYYILKLQV